MGGADCLIVAEAIELKYAMSLGEVAILTNDRRMHDVVCKCRSLGIQSSKDLGLIELAETIGYKWSQSLYPVPLHLTLSTQSELVQFFGHWPMPERRVIQKLTDELTEIQRKVLYRTAKSVQDSSGVGPDSLPYKPQMEVVQMAFANESGIYLSKADIGQQLLRWRKNPASRPEL